MSGSRVRVALIGIQHPHIEQVVQEVGCRADEIEFVALAEAEDPIRERWQARLGVPAYADYAELLEREQPDVAAIAGINGERASMIVASFQAGAHVVVDKPMCTTLDQLASIESAWRDSGRMLHCLLEKRLCPETLALEQVLASGELGDLALAWGSGPHRLRSEMRPEWMFRRDSYGGIVNDLAVHDVDLLLRFTEPRSVSVQAWTGNRAFPDRPEFEDHRVLLLRTDAGMLATIEIHWFRPDAASHDDYRMVLTGTQGTAEVHFLAGEALLATHTQPTRQLPLPPSRDAAADFFDAVCGLAPAAITAEQALAATRISLIAQAHANDGVWRQCEIAAAVECDA
jgi:predicted dehydrogenase